MRYDETMTKSVSDAEFEQRWRALLAAMQGTGEPGVLDEGHVLEQAAERHRRDRGGCP